MEEEKFDAKFGKVRRRVSQRRKGQAGRELRVEVRQAHLPDRLNFCALGEGRLMEMDFKRRTEPL